MGQRLHYSLHMQIRKQQWKMLRISRKSSSQWKLLWPLFNTRNFGRLFPRRLKISQRVIKLKWVSYFDPMLSSSFLLCWLLLKLIVFGITKAVRFNSAAFFCLYFQFSVSVRIHLQKLVELTAARLISLSSTLLACGEGCWDWDWIQQFMKIDAARNLYRQRYFISIKNNSLSFGISFQL